MSSLLRSSNYFRLYLNLNRTLTSAASPNKFSRNVIRKQVIPAVSVAHRNYVAYAETERVNIESLLDKLDSTVKRTSRVNKNDVDRAIQYIEKNHLVTPSQALLILRCCGAMLPEELPETRTKMVEQLWRNFKNLGIKFDISHYNALLKVYLENEHMFTPSEFLLDLEKNGVEPNRVTYQRLLEHFCRAGDIEGATKILEFMKEKELPINEQVFNSLILGHSNCNDLESAEGILNMMKAAGLQPSNTTYTMLMSGYAKTGNINKIKEIITQCENSDILLLDRDYLEVAYALAVSGHKDLIAEVLSRVRRVLDYNQDAINITLRLIASGQDDAAFEIYKTMNKSTRVEEGSTEGSSDGNFFIRQLVRCNRPLDKIKHYLEIMGQENSNPFVYMVAVRTALRDGTMEQSKDMMKLAEEKGFPIRAHYFWPLIKKESHEKDVEGIYSVLTMMIQDFNIFQLRETLRENLIYDLLKCGETWQSIMDRLTSLGVPSGTVSSAIVFNLLTKNAITQAAEVVSQYRAYYQPYFIRPVLLKAFYKTGDLNSFLTVMRAMYLSVQRQEEYSDSVEESDDLLVPDKRLMVTKTVYEVLSNFSKNKSDANKIEEFLQGLLDNGLGISEECGEKIQQWIKPGVSPELGNIIEKLTSEDLEPVPLSLARAGSIAHDEKTLEHLAETLSKKGKPTDGIKIQLFQFYCRNKQVEKALKIKKELEDSGKTLSDGQYAILTDMYIALEDIEKAMEIVEFLRKDDPNFNLDYAKTLKLATLLIQKDRIEDATQLLENYPVEEKKGEESLYLQNNLCWKLLNAVADKKDAEHTEKFLNLLTSKHFVEVSNILLGPIIKAYLNRNDLKGAVDKFEEYCRTYNCTPMKNEIMLKLIEVEDAPTLQRVTDLSTEIHGEVNSLYDLMAAFLEIGRVRQARKILETPGLRIRQDRLTMLSRRFAEDKNEEKVRRLLEVTKGIHNVDRSSIYLANLEIYVAENNVEKAYGLWTEMQEEDESPSDEFLIKLANLLRKNQREVPFEVPDAPKQMERKSEKVGSDIKSVVRRFENYVQRKNSSQALMLKDHPSIPVVAKSELIELLVQENQMNEAKKMVLSILQKGDYPKLPHFRYFLQTLSQSGDIQTFNEIGEHLNEDLKKEVYYIPKLFTAYQNAGKSVEFIKYLESQVESARDVNIRSVYPLRTILKAVIEEPQLLPHVEAVCEKLKKKNFVEGDMTLWNAYFALNMKPEEMDKLFKSLSQTECLYFVPLLKLAETSGNLGIVERLKQVVFQETDTPRLNEKKGILISAEIRILNGEGKIEEALNRLESGLKVVDISYLRTGPLLTLKKKAEVLNIPFNYSIPEKNFSQDDDDDESIPRAQ